MLFEIRVTVGVAVYLERFPGIVKRRTALISTPEGEEHAQVYEMISKALLFFTFHQPIIVNGPVRAREKDKDLGGINNLH